MKGMGRKKKCDGDCLNCPLPDCVVDRTRKEYLSEYYAAVYQKRKAAGLCTRCGKLKAGPDCLICSECRAKVNMQNSLARKRRRARLIAAGLCERCGKVPAMPGIKKCESCAQKSAAAASAHYRRKKEERNGTEEKM